MPTRAKVPIAALLHTGCRKRRRKRRVSERQRQAAGEPECQYLQHAPVGKAVTEGRQFVATRPSLRLDNAFIAIFEHRTSA